MNAVADKSRVELVVGEVVASHRDLVNGAVGCIGDLIVTHTNGHIVETACDGPGCDFEPPMLMRIVPAVRERAAARRARIDGRWDR